jgi:hypothetical protein
MKRGRWQSLPGGCRSEFCNRPEPTVNEAKVQVNENTIMKGLIAKGVLIQFGMMLQRLPEYMEG